MVAVAKVKAPFFGLGASGQLGKAIVYFGWKGINVVREFVIPSNPQTALQVTQRGYVTAAVAKIHAAQADPTYPMISQDLVAYAALASALGKIWTWFNQAVKLWVDVMVAGNTPVVYTFGSMVDKDHADARMFIAIFEETASDLSDGKFYLGTSRTNLIQSKDATIIAGSHATLNAGFGFDALTAGVKYYWQFRPDSGDPCVGANSGIYSFVAT